MSKEVKPDTIALRAIRAHGGIDEGRVIRARHYSTEIVVLEDCGILGIREHYLPILDGVPEDEAEHRPRPEPVREVPPERLDATKAAVREAERLGVRLVDVARSVNYGRVTVYDVRNYAREKGKSQGESQNPKSGR